MEIRNCGVCGTPFIPKQRNSKFCGRKCSHKAWYDKKRKRFKPKSCAYCGKIFTPLTAKNRFCSRKCRYKFWDEAYLKRRRLSRKPKICTICGANFVSNYPNIKVCSPTCRKEREKRRNKRWRELNRESILQTDLAKYHILRKDLVSHFGAKCYLCQRPYVEKYSKRFHFHEIHGKPHKRSFAYIKLHKQDFRFLCSKCHSGTHWAMEILGLTWEDIITSNAKIVSILQMR